MTGRTRCGGTNSLQRIRRPSAAAGRTARFVGYILQNISVESDIPWHRVVNARGEVSCSPSRNGGDTLQRTLLDKEGVEFDDRNRFDLERFRWMD